jgi:hypothetical protein
MLAVPHGVETVALQLPGFRVLVSKLASKQVAETALSDSVPTSKVVDTAGTGDFASMQVRDSATFTHPSDRPNTVRPSPTKTVALTSDGFDVNLLP